jgi:hypothetical protein
MANKRTLSELRFQAYLTAEGYVAEHDEIDWRARFSVATEKRPDYLVTRAREELAICEVKEFFDTPLQRRLNRQRVTTSGSEEVFGSAANAVQNAALEQLRPFAGVGLSLVVVLANPYGLIVPLGPSDMTMSLFGTTDTVQLRVGPGSPEPPVVRRVASGRGGLVDFDAAGGAFNPHPYLSAVVVVHSRTQAQDFVDAELARRRPERDLETHEERVEHMVANMEALNEAEREGRIPAGEYEWVAVYDVSDPADFSGTPLPANIFDGPRDRWYDLGPGGVFTERARGASAA